MTRTSDNNPAGRSKTPERQRLFTLMIMLTALGVILIVIPWPNRTPTAPSRPVVREFAVFDSYARFSLWTDPQSAERALTQCARELRAIHRTINRYDEDSELSHLNQTAGETAVSCSPRLWEALVAAREGYEVSDGAFDVSIGPLMALWGFHRKEDTLPNAADIEAARAKVGLQRVEFNEAERSIRFTVPGMSLDLGGIAKGYALDRIMTILERHGISRALVDLGGNIGCTALPPPRRQTFYIGIRNPFDPNAMLGRLRALGKAVATSGNYERRIVIQGKTIGHIIDPRTGRPVSGPAGVTAVTPRGIDSDIFSTAVFVRGKAMAERLAETVPDTGFVLISGSPQAPVRTAVGSAGMVTAE